MHEKTEIAAAGAKIAPPITVTGMTFMGYGVAEWVMLLTLIYTALQLVILLRNMVRQRYRQPECPKDCSAACPEPERD